MAKRKPREKLVYEETYQRGALMIVPHKLPTTPHATEGFKPHSAEIMKAGRVLCPDGVEREFQVIRILFDEG